MDKLSLNWGIDEEKVLLSEIKFSDKKLNKLNDLFEDRRKNIIRFDLF